jgi:hypothetical protein
VPNGRIDAASGRFFVIVRSAAFAGKFSSGKINGATICDGDNQGFDFIRGSDALDLANEFKDGLTRNVLRFLGIEAGFRVRRCPESHRPHQSPGLIPGSHIPSLQQAKIGKIRGHRFAER